MKKTTLAFLFLIFAGFTCKAQFPENFSGGSIPSTWAVFNNGIGTTNTWVYSNSGYLLCIFENISTGLVSEDYVVTPQFTVDATNYVLSFDTADYSATDTGHTLQIMVSTTSQTTIADFTTVATLYETDMDTPAYFQNETVNLSAYIGQAIYVAFVVSGSAAPVTDAFFLDDVEMIPYASAAPLAVTTPTPADGAIDVPLQYSDEDLDYTLVAFSWVPATTGDAAQYYKFNWGDSALELETLGTVAGTTVSIYGLDQYTTYYWQIVPVNSAGEATGAAIWSLTTGAPALSIKKQEVNIFSVYPNPVTDILNIKGDETVIKAEVYNQLGQQVLNLDSTSLTGNSLNLKNLKKGIYIVKLYSELNSQSIKITKE